MPIDILATIKADPEYRALADAGLDSELTDKIVATLPKSVPITVSAIRTAEPPARHAAN